MDKGKYSLSVIVPVYNAEFTLQRCIESILNQTYRDFELILVNDGSTDRSLDLCGEYAQKDNRIKVIDVKNNGPFQARKAGAYKASGKILTFSDADDMFDENAFECAIQIFYKYNPDIFLYTYDCEGKMEEQLYNERLYNREEILNEIIPGMMYDPTFGKRRLNPSLCCKVIKKNIFIQVVESVQDRITLGEDALVTYPAICISESIFICNKILYHYNNNPISCTHQYPLERIVEVKSFQENLIRLFKKMGVFPLVEWQVENYIRSFLAIMIKNWYEIEYSPILYSFPYKFIEKGEKIFIYGAGNVGKSYVNELKVTCYAKIVGWADKNYNVIKRYHDIDIVAPDQIKNRNFEILVIAIADEKLAKKLAIDLNIMGISKEKIFWRKPICII